SGGDGLPRVPWPRGSVTGVGPARLVWTGNEQAPVGIPPGPCSRSRVPGRDRELPKPGRPLRGPCSEALALGQAASLLGPVSPLSRGLPLAQMGTADPGPAGVLHRPADGGEAGADLTDHLEGDPAHRLGSQHLRLAGLAGAEEVLADGLAIKVRRPA